VIRVGLIGCGAIGSSIARVIDEDFDEVDLVAVFDRDIDKALELVKKLKRSRPRVTSSIEEMLEQSIDLVIEAASPEAVERYIVDIVARGKSIVVLSSGAFLNRDLLQKTIQIAENTGARIYIPSGAIGGIDILKAASLLGINELVLTTRKNPKALGLDDIDKPLTIFEGDVIEAVKRFPLNINIAATIALATNKTPIVKIIADPNINENIHEIYAKGLFGEIRIEIRNKRIDEKSRSSLITVFSVLQLLKQLSRKNLTIGT